eukprot:scaffold57500_cov38-Cyclotella_meneghiniana.AAC.2
MPLSEYRCKSWVDIFYNVKCYDRHDNTVLIEKQDLIRKLQNSGSEALDLFRSSLHFIDVTKGCERRMQRNRTVVFMTTLPNF